MTAGRAELLALLAGRRQTPAPAFSGLLTLTTAGLEAAGLRLAEVHQAARPMARAAASTFQLTGLPCAVAPLDLCVEAEALGAGVDFRAGAEPPEFPAVDRPLAQSLAEVEVSVPADFEHRGRLPVAAEALRQLKEDFGDRIVVGAYLPGPFTLLTYVLPPAAIYADIGRPPANYEIVMASLTEALLRAGRLYRAAGADFLTIHEMGGSPGVLGPRRFKAVVLPYLQRLLADLPGPRVLSVCGRAGPALAMLAEAGADALSFDQLTDLAEARKTLGPAPVLFGNLDPLAVLARSDPAGVRAAAAAARAAGADAVWPGCDLWPGTPLDNLRALAE